MATNPLPEVPPNLKMAASLFAQWRKTRPYRRAATPMPLRQQAVALLTCHPKRQIATALGIKIPMLNQWQTQLDGQGEAGDHTADFVALALESESSLASPPSTLHIILRYAGGSEVTLQGDFSSSQLTALMRGLHPVRERGQ